MSLFKKVVTLLKSMEPIAVDPDLYGDPRAKQVSWKPNQKGGANFQTATLDFSTPHKIIVKRSKVSVALALVFIAMGLGVSYLGIQREDFVPFIGAIVLFFAGFIIGFYPKGKAEFDTLRAQLTYHKKTYRFEEVIAIQIIEEWVRSGKSSYYSWELNIVLQNFERLTILDHGSLETLREDAHKIARALNVQVWDASQDLLKSNQKKE